MEEHALRSLSLSYQKKDLQEGPCQSIFGYDTDGKIVFYCLYRILSRAREAGSPLKAAVRDPTKGTPQNPLAC